MKEKQIDKSHLIVTESKSEEQELKGFLAQYECGGGDGGEVEPPPVTDGGVDDADILTTASADEPFDAGPQDVAVGFMGQYEQFDDTPEDGHHGNSMPGGGTLRFGKIEDPVDDARNALLCAVAPTDPKTSGGTRVELSFPQEIEYDKVYWLAVAALIEDWGTLPTSDECLFAFQVHSGDNSLGLSPSIALHSVPKNARRMQIQARYSESGSPSSGNTVTERSQEVDTPFDRWLDIVVKFKHNVDGSGFCTVWLDGQKFFDHHGNLGFKTPGFHDFAKFGYYNWSGSGMKQDQVRRVLLRNPTTVVDPSGEKYTADALRALLA